MENKIIYIVMAYRWGDETEHAYFVSCRHCPLIAYADTIIESNCRGGKYECSIAKSEINDSLDNVPNRIIYPEYMATKQKG